MDGHHHLHLRKRRSTEHIKKLEPYPARTPWKRILDKVMLGVGAMVPLVSIPQVFLIYSSQNASGVSPFTFFMLALFNILWFTYGLVHREKPIIIMYSLWFISNSLIFIGVLLYG